MVTVAPYSALNQYQTTPVGSVVQNTPAATTAPKAKFSTTQLDDRFKDQKDFATELQLKRKIADNFMMAQANASLEKASIYSLSTNAGAASYAMQNLLQTKFLPDA